MGDLEKSQSAAELREAGALGLPLDRVRGGANGADGEEERPDHELAMFADQKVRLHFPDSFVWEISLLNGDTVGQMKRRVFDNTFGFSFGEIECWLDNRDLMINPLSLNDFDITPGVCADIHLRISGFTMISDHCTDPWYFAPPSRKPSKSATSSESQSGRGSGSTSFSAAYSSSSSSNSSPSSSSSNADKRRPGSASSSDHGEGSRRTIGKSPRQKDHDQQKQRILGGSMSRVEVPSSPRGGGSAARLLAVTSEECPARSLDTTDGGNSSGTRKGASEEALPNRSPTGERRLSEKFTKLARSMSSGRTSSEASTPGHGSGGDGRGQKRRRQREIESPRDVAVGDGSGGLCSGSQTCTIL